jgi:moderate conductance mechanosensitive channel
MNFEQHIRLFLDTYIDKALIWATTTGPKILIILILTGVALKMARVITNRLFGLLQKNKTSEFQKRADTLRSIVWYIASISISAVSLVTILDVLGIDIGPILAAAGIVGVAVGFGSQTLVQDVISGFFIFIEDQIRVGDVVEIAGKSGLVEKITLRIVELRDSSGNVHIIRNGNITMITNMTKEYSRYVFDIGFSYHADVDTVMAVIRKVDEDMRKDPEYASSILEPIEILGLDRFADSAVMIQARTKTIPSQQWRVGREFNRRFKKAFDEHGIEIPYPHVTLITGAGMDKQALAASEQIVDNEIKRS